MTKIYTKEINKCDNCPFIRTWYDEARDMWRGFCNQEKDDKDNQRKVYLENSYIPKWCPLPDKKEQEK